MTYLRLSMIAVCPVIASVLLYLMDKKTSFGKLNNRTKQIIFGVIFGILAILGTEFGVPINGAVINARDAAPLCCGLIFGPTAGILSGLIGGLERWFAVYWGAGTYTQIACSVSTVVAGLLGAVLRKWMFDDKKPAWYYGFAVTLVMEVFHMLMIFFTNISDVQHAFSFVKICSAPMILVNSLSVMLAVLIITFLGKERLHVPKEHKKLSQTFSRWLLLVVLVAFAFTSAFTYILQTKFSNSNSENLLRLNLEDVKADIEYASDTNLLRLTGSVASEINLAPTLSNELLLQITGEAGNDFSEINVINQEGIITFSTTPENIGFDMSKGEQSKAFLFLLSQGTSLVQRYQPISRDGSYMKYAGVALMNGGFVQVGYNAERFQKDIDAQVIGATQNRHVGENGYIMIASEDFRIVSDREDFDERELSTTTLQKLIQSIPENVRFEALLFDATCYCMYTTSEGYFIIAAEPVSEVLFARDLSVYVTLFMEVLIFAVLFAIIYFLIKKLVVENIHKINYTLSEITGGNLNVEVNVRTNEEFISLSDDINSTVVTLKGFIDEAAARIDKELEMAKIIQFSSLPSVFQPDPNRHNLDIFASMDTAKEVGGDFYDFYLLDNDRLAFLIADVSGKGITAAMFMMKSKTLLKGYAEKEHDIAQIITKANDALCEGNDAEMFVTCWMGIMNLSTHIVSFVNAGHNAPLIRRKNGNFEYFKSKPGFVLGYMEETEYHSGEFSLEPGEEIYLYTDGITEATDKDTNMYGDDRLKMVLNTLPPTSFAEDICHGVKTDVDQFVGDAPQFDDMTMLHIKVLT